MGLLSTPIRCAQSAFEDCIGKRGAVNTQRGFCCTGPAMLHAAECRTQKKLAGTWVERSMWVYRNAQVCISPGEWPVPAGLRAALPPPHTPSPRQWTAPAPVPARRLRRQLLWRRQWQRRWRRGPSTAAARPAGGCKSRRDRAAQPQLCGRSAAHSLSKTTDPSTQGSHENHGC